MTALDAEDQQREIRRLEQRELMQRRLTESALVEVASVLNPRVATPVRESVLLSAVGAVGDALGVEIRPPLRSENPDRIRDPIEAIARASRVQHRRVLLREAWWKSDCGPLVGYLKETESPVALLSPRAGGCEIVDPPTHQK